MDFMEAAINCVLLWHFTAHKLRRSQRLAEEDKFSSWSPQPSHSVAKNWQITFTHKLCIDHLLNYFLDSSSRSKMKLQLRIEDSQSRFCTYCDNIASGNVKHCKLCERCVVHMDHHCLFLLRCVATNNHRLFVMFIIAVNVDITLFLFSTIRYFHMTYHALSFGVVFSILAIEHIFLLCVMILNFVSMFWGLSLVQWQLRLISLGYTYYESISVSSMDDIKSEIVTLTAKDRLMNLARFFQGNKTPYKRSTEMV